MLWVVTPNNIPVLYSRSRIILFVLINVLALAGVSRIILHRRAENKEADRLDSAVHLETLDSRNKSALLQQLQREDIFLQYAADIDETVSISEHDTTFGLKNCCFAIKYNNKYVGVISIGESSRRQDIPDELTGEKYYILQDILIDNRYRRIGIGSAALAKATDILFDRYGDRPILAQCAKGNEKALMFFKKNNFVDSGELNRAGTDCFLIF